VENLTNIKFNHEEMQLLKYGLNYSVEKPVTTYGARKKKVIAQPV
jgi:hypothetical protein